MTTVLVTGAGGPLGVNLTRSLRDAPETLRLIGTDANRWHLPLSICDETYLIPYARDAKGYESAMRDIVATEQVDVIIPTHPVEVRAMAGLRDAHALDVGMVLPRTGVIELADSKALTYEQLRAADVPVPETMLLTDASDVERAFAQLKRGDEPVWIRGAGTPGSGIGGAALPCRSTTVACAWIEHYNGWGQMAASEYLPGANLSWMALFNHGELLAAGCRERLEYVLPHIAPSGITGAPAVSRTVDRSDVAAVGARAVAAIDDAPHGVYFVDLKEDSAGGARVTEINAGRCGTTVRAYVEAGCNFPWLLAQLARGDDVAAPADPLAAVEVDVYWVRTLDCGPVALRGESGFDAYPKRGVD